MTEIELASFRSVANYFEEFANPSDLIQNNPHLLQAAAAWALGQAGRHTPEHAKAVAQANVLPTLLQCYLRAGSSEDLQTKVRQVLLYVSICV